MSCFVVLGKSQKYSLLWLSSLKSVFKSNIPEFLFQLIDNVSWLPGDMKYYLYHVCMDGDGDNDKVKNQVNHKKEKEIL